MGVGWVFSDYTEKDGGEGTTQRLLYHACAVYFFQCFVGPYQSNNNIVLFDAKKNA